MVIMHHRQHWVENMRSLLNNSRLILWMLKQPHNFDYEKEKDDMIIDDVRFELKDGREAILRSPKEEDVESTLEYLVTSAGETDYILRYPEECGKYTAEGEKTLFEQKNASPNEAMIMCIVEGKVVGN